MSETYKQIKEELKKSPKRWLITGVAGFIGSNLLETLLELDQEVVGLDNFRTGKRANLLEVQTTVGPERWSRFHFVEGDITSPKDCHKVMAGVDYVLHQAALGSVPQSIEDPSEANRINVSGFLNVFEAAKDAKVKRVVYASSSAVYGDAITMPLSEDDIGKPISPYAVNKYVNELYAITFARNYGLESVGLRYFNVFGKRQDPNGSYAAVIPRWIEKLLSGGQCSINGDGETSRDFVHVNNVVQANILAATSAPTAANEAYNIGNGGRSSLNELFYHICEGFALYAPEAKINSKAYYAPFRDGDIRHSQANIGKAVEKLHYHPEMSVAEGLAQTIMWYSHMYSRELVA
ncbi:MAG: SDR family oxidoreductase [Deinococcales bacterium]